jgi:hypothetical protein
VKKTKRRLKVKPFFHWYDLYVGAYFNAETQSLYILPLPTLGLRFRIEQYRTCGWCGEEQYKAALWTGEGWALFWSCALNCDEDEYLPWPWEDDRPANGEDLEAMGFTIV